MKRGDLKIKENKTAVEEKGRWREAGVKKGESAPAGTTQDVNQCEIRGNQEPS